MSIAIGLFIFCGILFAWAGYAPEQTEPRTFRLAFATGGVGGARRERSPRRERPSRRDRKGRGRDSVPEGGSILAAEFGATAVAEPNVAEDAGASDTDPIAVASSTAPLIENRSDEPRADEGPQAAAPVESGGEAVEPVDELAPAEERPALTESDLLAGIPGEALDQEEAAEPEVPEFVGLTPATNGSGTEKSPAERLSEEADPGTRSAAIREYANRGGEEARDALINVAMFAATSVDRVLAVELLSEMGELDACALALNDPDKGVAIAAALAVCSNKTAVDASTLLRARVDDEMRATELVTIVRAFGAMRS